MTGALWGRSVVSSFVAGISPALGGILLGRCLMADATEGRFWRTREASKALSVSGCWTLRERFATVPPPTETRRQNE